MNRVHCSTLFTPAQAINSAALVTGNIGWRHSTSSSSSSFACCCWWWVAGDGGGEGRERREDCTLCLKYLALAFSCFLARTHTHTHTCVSGRVVYIFVTVHLKVLRDVYQIWERRYTYTFLPDRLFMDAVVQNRTWPLRLLWTPNVRQCKIIYWYYPQTFCCYFTWDLTCYEHTTQLYISTFISFFFSTTLQNMAFQTHCSLVLTGFFLRYVFLKF